MTSPLLSLQKIGHSFGKRAILKNLHLDMHAGEFVLLVGNNGSGKTTLLRIISGLLSATQGQCFFEGMPYEQNMDALRQNLGYLSYQGHSYSDLSVLENLKLFGTLYHVPNLSSKIQESLSFVQLEHAQHLYVNQLSSGMMKRLSIAKLFLYSPKLLLLDEPYTALDHQSIQLLKQYLVQHQAQGGSTLLVSHQLQLGLEQASRVLLLHDRHLLHDEPASRVTLEQCHQWLSLC